MPDKGEYDCPPFVFVNDLEVFECILELLEASGPNMVFVALGFPEAEKLINRVIDRLEKARWIVVVISLCFCRRRSK